jgi:hypothetical protein
MGSFFGGKSKSETDSHSTQTTTPWDKAVPGLDLLMNGITGSLTTPPQFYPGQTYLNMDRKQMGGLNDVYNNAAGSRDSIVNPALDAWKNLMGGPDQSNWDNALRYYTDRAGDNLSRNIIPGINDEAILSGGRTSSRAGIAEGLARADTGRDILGYNNELAMNFESLKQSGEQAALGMAPNMFNLNMAPGNAMYEAATALRGDQQNKLNEDISRYNYNRDAPLENMQRMYSMLFPMAQGFGTTTSDNHSETTQSTQSPIFDKLLGAGLATYGIMNPTSAMGSLGSFGSMSSGGGIGMMGLPGMDSNRLATNLYFDPMNPSGVSRRGY